MQLNEFSKTSEIIPLSELIFGTFESTTGEHELVTAEKIFKVGTNYKIARVLGSYAPFASDQDLQEFVAEIPDLSPWKYRIPEADSVKSRVTLLYSALYDKKRADGRNALDIFLRNLVKAELNPTSKDSVQVSCPNCKHPNHFDKASCDKCSAAIIHTPKFFVFK
ncbi:hypothetical protein KBC79_02805 [Candidatus Woesebacteria bacterium]|nr:hypothetical protein [Candidatus Woesebacteria bacterium]